jgi:putative membrane protein
MQSLFKSKADTKAPKQRNASRVRDHLANERTYLAWMRTAIALMGFGVVIVRVRIIQPNPSHSPGSGWKLGLVFSLAGLVMVLISSQHYFAVRRSIDEDSYEPPDRWVILSSFVVMLLGIGVIYYVFTAPLNPLGAIPLE